MFYSYFDTRVRMRPYSKAGITYSRGKSAIQAIQQESQVQQQMQQGIQPYYSFKEIITLCIILRYTEFLFQQSYMKLCTMDKNI